MSPNMPVPLSSTAAPLSSPNSFLTCPACGGTRFSFAVYDVHVFDSETGEVYDAEDSGKEELICRGCGHVTDEGREADGEIIEAMLVAWAQYCEGPSGDKAEGGGA